ncbi:hypothetical protein N7463_009481, partial [Penicillium fimorum]
CSRPSDLGGCTTNTLANEPVRFLMKGDNLHILPGWLRRVVSLVRTPSLTGALKQAMALFLSLVHMRRYWADARRVMFTFAWILSCALLTLDAERVEDEPYQSCDSTPGSEEHTRLDWKITWGVKFLAKVIFGHRSLRESSKL